MQTASDWRSTEKSVVALRRFLSTSSFTSAEGDVKHVGDARVDIRDFAFGEVDANNGEPRFGEFHAERQTHVAQTDYCNLHRTLPVHGRDCAQLVPS